MDTKMKQKKNQAQNKTKTHRKRIYRVTKCHIIKRVINVYSSETTSYFMAVFVYSCLAML